MLFALPVIAGRRRVVMSWDLRKDRLPAVARRDFRAPDCPDYLALEEYRQRALMVWRTMSAADFPSRVQH